MTVGQSCHFELNAGFNRKPVKLFEERNGMISSVLSENETSSIFLGGGTKSLSSTEHSKEMEGKH